MLKKNKVQIIWSTLVCLLPIVIGLCLWPILPEKIPTHWNFEGQINGWSSKAFAIFGIGGILLACHLLCVFGTAMDPKHKNMQGKMLHLIYWIVPVLSVFILNVMYAVALGAQLRMEVWVIALIGVLFIIMGNWLPKCRPNYTVGIRLPWTIHSEENWRKTHRMAGPVWVACGVVTMLCAFLGIVGKITFIAVLVVMCLVPTVYSYLLYRRSEKE